MRNFIYVLVGLAVVIIGGVLYAWTVTPAFNSKNIMTLFILLFCIERTWENFFSSHEQNRLKFEGDWCLVLVSVCFMVTSSSAFIEFFVRARGVNWTTTIIGLALFIAALYLRLYSMRILGDQWAVHILGSRKLATECRLIESGPYRYIRHP